MSTDGNFTRIWMQVIVGKNTATGKNSVLALGNTTEGHAFQCIYGATFAADGKLASMTSGRGKLFHFLDEGSKEIQEQWTKWLEMHREKWTPTDTNEVYLVRNIFRIAETEDDDYSLNWATIVEEAVKSMKIAPETVSPMGEAPDTLLDSMSHNKSNVMVFNCESALDKLSHDKAIPLRGLPLDRSKGVAGDSTVAFCTTAEKEFPRPNGDSYHAREIMGHTDVALLRKLRDTDQYVQLVGPPGAGKTALAEAAFGADLITVHGHGDLMVQHLVGSYIPNRDKQPGQSDWLWQDGPLTIAMREGRALLIDEATRIPSETLDVVISATDGRKVISLDDRPDAPKIHAAQGFYVIMSYNPETLSGRQLDPAIRSRFGFSIQVETDFESAKVLNIPNKAIKVAQSMQLKSREDRSTGGRGYWVPQMRELLQYKKIVDTQLGEAFAMNNLFAQCPDEMSRTMLQETIADVMKVKKSTVVVPELGGMI